MARAKPHRRVRSVPSTPATAVRTTIRHPLRSLLGMVETPIHKQALLLTLISFAGWTLWNIAHQPFHPHRR